MPPLLADFIHNRVCKLRCEKFLTRPTSRVHTYRPILACDGGSAKEERCILAPQGAEWASLLVCRQQDRDAVAAIASRSFVFDELSEQAIEEATIDEAVWSSMIEGAFTSKAEAARIIRQNKSPANKSEQLVKNNYQALLYVLEHLEDPITVQTLIDIARIVTRGASDETVEGFRSIPVYVSGREGIVYTPPDASLVPAMVDDLIAFITGSEFHPLLKACIAHFYFVYEHPFTDGNGRAARALS